METVSLNTVPDRTSKISRYALYFRLCSLCLENVVKHRLSFFIYYTRLKVVQNGYLHEFFYYVCFFGKPAYNHQYSLNWQEFHRQGDSNTVDQHKLPVPVTVRYLRFNPTQRHAWNCLRVEVHGTEGELLPLLTLFLAAMPKFKFQFFVCVVVMLKRLRHFQLKRNRSVVINAKQEVHVKEP